MDKPELIVTADGSHTLFHPGLKEHYHSVNGAIQESQYIFISQGFRCLTGNREKAVILEVGFGTGLNALLTVIAAREKSFPVHYVALEPFPVPEDLLKQVNYPGLVGSCQERVLFTTLHRCPWGKPAYLEENFILMKLRAGIREVSLQAGQFDLVYFDAFSPGVQPEMWTEEVFAYLFRSMAPGGLLLTYSAKGDTKRALKSVGFTLEGLPGPKGKREITRAAKPREEHT